MKQATWLSVSEVSRRLQISRPSVHRLIERGELAALKAGRIVRVAEADLQAFIDSHMVGRRPAA